jgi:hypothetical protein
MAKQKKDQGLTYCRPKVRDELHNRGKLIKTSACPICNFHIRGKNHSEGSHHVNSPGAVAERKRIEAGLSKAAVKELRK